MERYPEVRVQLTLSDRPNGPLEEGVDLALQVGSLPAPVPLYAVYAHRELSATVRVFVEFLEQYFLTHA